MISVIGSVNADLVSFMPRFPKPGETVTGKHFAMYQGGKGANQAVGVAKLGGKVRFFGAVGDDEFGDFLVQELKKAGVDTTFVKRTNGESGVASIWVNEKGENSIVLSPGANAQLDAKMINSWEAAFESASHLLLQLETPLSGVLQASKMAKSKGAKVILDPAPAVKLPRELLENVDYITPNEVEISIISEGRDLIEKIQWLESMGPKVLVKAGSKGVYMLKDGKLEKFNAFKVKAVDTTGAGDCFNAALTISLSEGAKIKEACEFAMAAAAISVTRKGAAVSFPSREEVERFLKGRDDREA